MAQLEKYSKEWHTENERKAITNAIRHNELEYHGLCDACEYYSDILWKTAKLEKHKDWLKENHPEHYDNLYF